MAFLFPEIIVPIFIQAGHAGCLPAEGGAVAGIINHLTAGLPVATSERDLLHAAVMTGLESAEAWDSDDAGIDHGRPASASPESAGERFVALRFNQTSRRHSGSYYTPESIIDTVLDQVAVFRDGEPAPDDWPVCDPAMGCGFFLLRLAARLRQKTNFSSDRARRWCQANIYGVDLDPGAVFMTRLLLWAALSDKQGVFLPDPGHFRCGDALLGEPFGARNHPVHPEQEAGRTNTSDKTDRTWPIGDPCDWPRCFPAVAAGGGFAAVIGNPPYEVLTNFSRHPHRRIMAEQLRASGYYTRSLHGQINLYRCFIERSLSLTRPGGAVSLVVPLSLARDSSAVDLRRHLIEEHQAENWFMYGETERPFPGVAQAACIFSCRRDGGPAGHIRVTAKGKTTVLSHAEWRAATGTAATVQSYSPAERSLLTRLRSPRYTALSNLVQFRVGEVDQTMYRRCLRDDRTEWLLLRGEHLSPFHADLNPVPGKERFLDADAFLAMKGESAPLYQERVRRPRVAQLGIRNMNCRPRLAAALVPPGVYLGNSLNALTSDNLPLPVVAALCNSRLLDWLFRKQSGNNNINIVEMRSLPFPMCPPDRILDRVAAAFTACETAAGGGGDLEMARRDLDAAVAELYKLPGRYIDRLWESSEE